MLKHILPGYLTFWPFQGTIFHAAYQRNKKHSLDIKTGERHVCLPILAIVQASKSSTSSFPHIFHHFPWVFPAFSMVLVFHGFSQLSPWLHRGSEASSISRAASRGSRAPSSWGRARAASSSRRISRRTTCRWWCALADGGIQKKDTGWGPPDMVNMW